MPYFDKVVDAEGKETFVEVPDDKLKLPETHPLVVSLEKVKAESIKRRHQLEAVQQTAADEDEEDDDAETQPAGTPAPVVKPAKPAKPVSPAAPVPTAKEIAAEAVQMLRDEARVSSEAQNARKNAIDLIIKETGLNPALRETIEAIPDLSVAKQQAITLAKHGLRFDPTPIGENGEQDVTGLTGKATAKLGFVERKK